VAVRHAPDMGASIAPVVVVDTEDLAARFLKPTTAAGMTVRAGMNVHIRRRVDRAMAF
jgi:hypothetical protein